MDAVLPLRLSDVPRSEILFESLRRNVIGLETLWLVMPSSEVSRVAAGFASHSNVRVLSERELLPELAVFPSLHGWYRQQLIKLAIAERVETHCYLTLDADVIATRPLSLDRLIVGGRAPCYIDYADLHPKWYSGARAILGLPLPHARISHNVTPCVLHRGAVASLLVHLNQCWRERRFDSHPRGTKQRGARLLASLWPGMTRSPWKVLLAASPPWSEYSLYFSFLEATGQFDRYHYEARQALYEPERSVWFEGQFEAWQPAELFAGSGPPYFVVVQSNANIPVDRIRAQLAPHLGID
jgi:Family of unknown function (DUF6492)